MGFATEMKTILKVDDSDWKKALKSVKKIENEFFQDSKARATELEILEKKAINQKAMNARKLAAYNKVADSLNKKLSRAKIDGDIKEQKSINKKIKLIKALYTYKTIEHKRTLQKITEEIAKTAQLQRAQANSMKFVKLRKQNALDLQKQSKISTAATNANTAATNANAKSKENLANQTIRYLRWAGTIAGVLYAANRAWSATLGIGIQVNKMMEDNTSGFAALLSANTQMILSNGQVVNSYEKFVIGQKVAKDAMEDIRKASVDTYATFPQLTNLVQQSIGHTLGMGKSFGKTTEEIIQNTIKFTQSMSNIAGSVGMEQQKATEEVRSMLSGNVSTDSLLAVMLFGSPTEANKAIKEAKTRGDSGVSDMLSGMMSAFEPLKDVKSYTRGLLQLEDAWSQAMMKMSEPLFESLKDTFFDLADSIEENTDSMVESFENVLESIEEIGSIVVTVSPLISGAFSKAADTASLSYNGLAKAIDLVLLANAESDVWLAEKNYYLRATDEQQYLRGIAEAYHIVGKTKEGLIKKELAIDKAIYSTTGHMTAELEKHLELQKQMNKEKSEALVSPRERQLNALGELLAKEKDITKQNQLQELIMKQVYLYEEEMKNKDTGGSLLTKEDTKSAMKQILKENKLITKEKSKIVKHQEEIKKNEEASLTLLKVRKGLETQIASLNKEKDSKEKEESLEKVNKLLKANEIQQKSLSAGTMQREKEIATIKLDAFLKLQKVKDKDYINTQALLGVEVQKSDMLMLELETLGKRLNLTEKTNDKVAIMAAASGLTLKYNQAITAEKEKQDKMMKGFGEISEGYGDKSVATEVDLDNYIGLLDSEIEMIDAQTQLIDSTNDWNSSLEGLAATLGDVSDVFSKFHTDELNATKAQLTLDKKYAKQYGKDWKEKDKNNEIQAKYDKEDIKNKEISFNNEMDGYADLAGAASSLFDQNSKEQKALQAFQLTMMIIKRANSIWESADNARKVAESETITLANIMESLSGSSKGVGFSGLISLALMVAALASLGLSSSGGSSGGSVSFDYDTASDIASREIDIIESNYEPILNRFDRQIELLESIDKHSGDALGYTIDRASADYARASSIAVTQAGGLSGVSGSLGMLPTLAQDILDARRNSLGEYSDLWTGGITGYIHTPTQLQTDFSYGVNTTTLSLNELFDFMAYLEENSLLGTFGYTAAEYDTIVDGIQQTTHDFTMSVIDSMSVLTDFADDLSDTFDSLTDSDFYKNQRLSTAMDDVERLIGEETLEGYIQRQISSIRELESQLSEEDISLLLSTDIDDIVAQRELMQNLQDETKTLLDSGVIDALNYQDSIALVGEAMVDTTEMFEESMDSLQDTADSLQGTIDKLRSASVNESYQYEKYKQSMTLSQSLLSSGQIDLFQEEVKNTQSLSSILSSKSLFEDDPYGYQQSFEQLVAANQFELLRIDILSERDIMIEQRELLRESNLLLAEMRDTLNDSHDVQEVSLEDQIEEGAA